MDAFLSSLPGTVAQGMIWGLMAIGVYLTFKILDIADLTVDGSFATGAVIFASLITVGCPAWLAMIAAFVSGLIAGLMTGVFHTMFGIPPILAGILTQLSLVSLNMKIPSYFGIKASTSTVGLYGKKTALLFVGENVKSPFPENAIFIIGIIIVVIIAILYWFFGTEFGCAMRATGCNANMSHAQGINTNYHKVVGLMLSNGLVAVAGSLYAQYNTGSDVTAGRGAIVIGLAAIIIGEILIGKYFSNFAVKLISVIVGGIIYYMVYQIIILVGIDTNYLKLITAVVVAVFLGVPYWKAQFANNSKKIAKNAANGGGENA